MLMYQMHPRVIKFRGDSKPTFPNKLRLQVTLAPSALFGCAPGQLRAAVLGAKARIEHDEFSGKIGMRSTPALPPLTVKGAINSDQFNLAANILRYEADCHDILEVSKKIAAIYYLLPVVLNAEFPEPPVIHNMCGWIGEIPFDWHLYETTLQMPVVSAELLQSRFSAAIQRLPFCTQIENQRLTAALHYFHVATRLIVVGRTDWEFMSEAIVNLDKALNVLFSGMVPGQTRDRIRKGLDELGVDAADREAVFLTITFLRDSFDGAHPSLARLNADENRLIYMFLVDVVGQFRELFRRVFERIDNDAYRLTPVEDVDLSDDDQKTLNKIIEKLKKKYASN